jgi:hypothetical protein
MTAAKKPAPRTNTATALAKRLDAFDDRLRAVEDLVGAAKRKQQQAAAAKLAQNPEQLSALRDLLALAEESSA